MLWTCKLLLTDLIKAAYQVPFGDFMQYQIYCITGSADSYCPSKWGTTKRYFSHFQENDAKLTQRRGSSSHGTDPNHCSVPHHVMEIRSTNQSNKTLDVYLQVYLQVTIKATQMIPYRPQKKAEGKGFFFLLLPFSRVFPWPNQRLWASETSCLLDKTGGKKKIPPVLLWDWKREAFTEHAETSGCWHCLTQRVTQRRAAAKAGEPPTLPEVAAQPSCCSFPSQQCVHQWTSHQATLTWVPQQGNTHKITARKHRGKGVMFITCRHINRLMSTGT